MDSHLGSVHSGPREAIATPPTHQLINASTTRQPSIPSTSPPRLLLVPRIHRPSRPSHSCPPPFKAPLASPQAAADLTHLADATRACYLLSVKPVPRTSIDISPAGPYSGPRLVGYAYSCIRVYSLPSRMFLYLFFVLDSSLVFASLIPFAFAIGHQPRRSLGLCAWCCASTHHSLTAFTLITEPLCLRRRAACRQ